MFINNLIWAKPRIVSMVANREIIRSGVAFAFFSWQQYMDRTVKRSFPFNWYWLALAWEKAQRKGKWFKASPNQTISPQ